MSRREAGDDRDDDALVVATAAGDLAAFRVLVERFAPRVHAFAVRALGSRADADDIVQETFVRAHRAAPRFVPAGRCAAWLFRIAGNLVRQEMRRRRVRGWLTGTPGVNDEVLLASLPAPRFFAADAPLADSDLRAALARALARLPERQRLAVLLRYFDGLAVRDVAAALNASEHATESLLARGTAALRRLLADEPR
jgi:RNA polymerase sigma-70 factor (ECF subfamily)